MLDALIWLGTIVFAISGALAAIERRFDLVGVLVLGAVTAVGGGSVRDLVTGVIPPSALTDEFLLWSVAVASLAVFFIHRFVSFPHRLLYIADTTSLALFAALGAQAGLAVGFGFWGTVFTGTVSGVGGGIIRDVFTGSIPGVLYRSGDFYATAAAAGAATAFLVDRLGGTETVVVVIGALVVELVRVGSRLLGLNLPVARTE